MFQASFHGLEDPRGQSALRVMAQNRRNHRLTDSQTGPLVYESRPISLHPMPARSSRPTGHRHRHSKRPRRGSPLLVSLRLFAGRRACLHRPAPACLFPRQPPQRRQHSFCSARPWRRTATAHRSSAAARRPQSPQRPRLCSRAGAPRPLSILSLQPLVRRRTPRLVPPRPPVAPSTAAAHRLQQTTRPRAPCCLIVAAPPARSRNTIAQLMLVH